MKRLALLFVAAALVATGASADDLSGRFQGSNGLVVLSVDSDANRVEYSIVTNGIGNLQSASIRRGGNTVANLDVGGGFGSAAGSVNVSNGDANAMQANPGQFSVRVVGSGGNLTADLESAGPSSDGVGGDPVDLQLKTLKVQPNGRLKLKIKNLSPDTDSVPTTAAIYFSEDNALGGGDTLLTSVAVPSVRAKKKRNVKVNVELPDGGGFIIAVVDPDDINQDPDRDNNTRSRSFN